jgi:hypothetical protein
MSNLEKKNKVILAMTRDSFIYECIVDNLKFIDKECILLNPPPIRIKLKRKFKIFFKTKIIKSKRHIKRYGDLLNEEQIIHKIKSISHGVESCLMIRPDIYSENIVDTLVNNIENTYAYQWDGLDRFPKVLDYINKFKKFYIYDKNDEGRFQNTSLITNFYFDCYLAKNIENPEYDIYYIGVYDDRINDLIKLCEKLNKLNLKMKILIFCSRKNRGKLNNHAYITEITKGITYKENLSNVFNTKALLDFSHKKTHTGLSLRPFEALGYSKKLITTNDTIKEYDFYLKENTLVFNNDISTESINSFLKKPYRKVQDSIFRRHSFSEWFKYITN